MAKQIAGAFGSRVLKNNSHNYGEPHAWFKIPIHADPFWLTIRIAENTFNFSAEHKRGQGAPNPTFGIALCHEYRPMFATKLSRRLSSLAGVSAYHGDLFDETDLEIYAALILETPSVAEITRQLVAQRVVHCYFNDCQLTAIMEMTSVDQAVTDILLLRQLILELYRLSRLYHPSL
jgi:hypothetical protein